MNEAETRAEHIDPALTAAGWGVVEGSRIRREYPITLGRIEGHGRRGKPLIADYVLVHRNHKLAVIEAKAWDEALTEGVGQAKDYAGKMAVRFAYSTNGQGFYGIDMQTGVEAPLPRFPTPDELWNQTFAEANEWRDRFAAIPFPDKGGNWEIRFYQEIAVNRVLERIADGSNRILLTLATGTGKTSIAFQIAWKLFQARWNLSGEPTRRPRVLFLADRNNLASQAFRDFTSFAAFEDNALARVYPEDIRKKGRVPTNASVFFTIFQTFMSGPANPSPVVPAQAGTQGPAPSRPPWTPAFAGATTEVSELLPSRAPYAIPHILAITRPISSTSSSSTNAIAAAPMTRAIGAASSNTLRRPCNSA
jgi:type I restriction enzyme R subunit